MFDGFWEDASVGKQNFVTDKGSANWFFTEAGRAYTESMSKAEPMAIRQEQSRQIQQEQQGWALG